MNQDMPIRSSASAPYFKQEQNDHSSHLSTFDTTSRFDVQVVITQTGIPLVSLRAWERNYGIPSPWEGEETSKLYSERDIAITLWLHKRVVIDQISIKQAIVELLHNSYDSTSNRNLLPAKIQLPSPTALSELRNKLLQAIVKMSRADAAHILSDAFALYAATVVCQQLLQPVLVFSSEMCRQDILSATAGTFARANIQLAYSFLIEACFTAEDASHYLTQLANESAESPQEGMYGQKQLTGEEVTRLAKTLIIAIYRDNRKTVEYILEQAFHSYDAEDVCLHLLHPTLVQMATLVKEQQVPAPAEQAEITLLLQNLTNRLLSMPNLALSPLILVGCATQGRSEIEALMLALFWRRAGLQVYYAGHIASASALVHLVLQMNPAFVYLPAALHTAIPELTEVSAAIARSNSRAVFCFGGMAFDQDPTLEQAIAGIYLGSQPEEIAQCMKDLLRLSPSFPPTQIVELGRPDSSIINALASSTLKAGSTILVGCTAQEDSEVGTLKLALLWRRAGLQIRYIGCINSVSALMQQIQQTQPDFIYLSTAQRISIPRIAKISKKIATLKNVHSTFCFGGTAFDQTVTLAQNITGIYLGSQPKEITQHLEELLRLSPLLTPAQITGFMAPNSFVAGFQSEISAANTAQASKEDIQHNMSPGAEQRPEVVSQMQENVPQKTVGWKGTIFYPGYTEIQKALPGLFFVVFPIALFAEIIWSLELRMHATFFVDIFIAAVLALVVANLFSLPEKVQAGLTFSTRWSLRLGILCYGLKFSFLPLLQSGLRNLVIVATSVTIALTVSISVGALLKVQPRLAALIGVGTGICGISATMATSPAIGASDEETAVALGTILCWGTTGLLLYPLISNLLHLAPEMYGIWTGTTIHDLPQLIAAAQQGGGTAALKAALFVKLIRIAFITVVVLFMNIFFSVKKGEMDTQEKNGMRVLRALKAFPLFVLGFFMIVFINTITQVPAWLAGPLATWPTTTFPTTISAVFLMFASISICARINRTAIKIAGVKALVLGLIGWVTQSVVIFIIAMWLPHHL